MINVECQLLKISIHPWGQLLPINTSASTLLIHIPLIFSTNDFFPMMLWEESDHLGLMGQKSLPHWPSADFVAWLCFAASCSIQTFCGSPNIAARKVSSSAHVHISPDHLQQYKYLWLFLLFSTVSVSQVHNLWRVTLIKPREAVTPCTLMKLLAKHQPGYLINLI